MPESLKDQGLFVGLAGNQPAHAEATLRALDLPVDVIGTSHGWGVAKPSPAFFERVVAAGGGDASSILYVGDRPDNDVRPALEAGMKTCLIRRGPWGHILDLQPCPSGACSGSTRWTNSRAWSRSTTRPAVDPPAA